MAKKLSLALAAVAILAFAIPAMASATVATLPANTKPTLPLAITGNGTEVTLKSNLLGAITCEKLVIKGELTKNTGAVGTEKHPGEVEGSSGEQAPVSQTNCKNGTKNVVVEKVKLTKLFSNSEQKTGATGTGTLSFTAVVKIGTELVCTFTGTNVPGSFVSGTNVITATEAGTITATPSSCGTSKLTAKFALVGTASGSNLILD